MANSTARKIPARKTPTKAQLEKQLNAAMLQNSYLVSRAKIASGLGKTFDGARDLYTTLGYPLNPQYEDFFNFYDRDGLATRIVDAVSDETWREHPTLIEGENKTIDELDSPSPLQQAFSEMADRLDLWAKFNEVDSVLGYSRFGLLYLGLPGETDQQAPTGQEIQYVVVCDEGSADISTFVTDITNPRYALPEYYQVTLDEEVGALSKRVHYSRVIHVREGRSRSRAYGTPRLRSMINRLIDLEKVVGSGSEAFYQLILRGMAFMAKEGFSIPGPDTEEYKAMQDEIDEWYHGLRRYVRLQGMEVQDLGGKPVTSKEQFEVIVSYLAGASHIPQRILIGSERGNLASSQDEYNYAGYIDSRRKKFAEIYILREFVDYCGKLGILDVPEKYTVHWPSLFQLTDLEAADIAVKISSAINTASGGAPETIIPPDEFAKRYLDYVPESPLLPDEQPIPEPQPEEQPEEQPEQTALNRLRAMFNNAFRPDYRKIKEVLSNEYHGETVLLQNGQLVKMNENEYSAMIAFRVPDVIRDELQKSYPFMTDETRDNLHITLCFLGDNRTLELRDVAWALAEFCDAVEPVKVKLQGIARFVSGNESDPVVMTVDSPELPALYETLVASLKKHGVPYHKEHGFIPHMTIAYIGKDEPMPVETIEPVEVNFSEVYFVSGDEWRAFRMGAEIEVEEEPNIYE